MGLEDRSRAVAALLVVMVVGCRPDGRPMGALDGAPGQDAMPAAIDSGLTRADASGQRRDGGHDPGRDGGHDGGIDPTLERLRFQCRPFDGGICEMRSDGSDLEVLHPTGFSPSGGVTVLFHSEAYRVMRLRSGGGADDLGGGAFARLEPDGRILFQCTGLGGGICRMNADGTGRETIRSTGRVPRSNATGALLFHTDSYRVMLRRPDGAEEDLGEGAFATWAPDGRIVLQCSGLGGGICRMNADGSGRESVRAAGRVPDVNLRGDLVFHSDLYTVHVATSSGRATALREGANAVWR